MGHFSVTCNITRLPLLGGEPCVVVVFEHEESKFTGSMDCVMAPGWGRGAPKCLGVFKGVYDTYGWIADQEKPQATRENVDHHYCFFHEHAWDRVVKAYDRVLTTEEAAIAELLNANSLEAAQQYGYEKITQARLRYYEYYGEFIAEFDAICLFIDAAGLSWDSPCAAPRQDNRDLGTHKLRIAITNELFEKMVIADVKDYAFAHEENYANELISAIFQMDKFCDECGAVIFDRTKCFYCARSKTQD